MAKKTKLVGPITYSCWFGFKMAQKSPKLWTEFLKSTYKPKKIQKSPLAGQLNPTNPPDIHLPNPLNRPKPINKWLTDGLSVNLFSTDRQWFCPIPDPPNPCPALVVSNKIIYFLKKKIPYKRHRDNNQRK